MQTQPLQGTRDFFPNEMRQRNWLFNIWKNLSIQYSYEEYDAPMVESLDLWIKDNTLLQGASLQEHSTFEGINKDNVDQKNGVTLLPDIINEMYTFQKDGIQMVLRPEMTRSLARMIMSRTKTLALPARWFSIPQCWRYETTTRGRRREFYQLNCDLIGAPPVRAEIEIILMIIRFFQQVRLNFNDVVIKISDKRIVEQLLTNYGIILPDKIAIVFHLIDKIDKMTSEEFLGELTKQIGLSLEIAVEFEKVIRTADLVTVRSLIGDCQALIEMEQILNTFNSLQLSDWIKLDLSIVRGLDYYNGPVFEAFAKESDLKRAICGGGRYDNLLSRYGAKPIPIIGFGMGDVVILDLLEEKSLLPNISEPVDYLVIAFNDELYGSALIVAEQMRQLRNYRVQTYIGKNKLKQALDYANRIGAVHVVIVAPDEWKDQKVIVKKMISTIYEGPKYQQIVSLNDFLSTLN